jgi:hypothetical protein
MSEESANAMQGRDDLWPMGYQDENSSNCQANGHCAVLRACKPPNESHRLSSNRVEHE